MKTKNKAMLLSLCAILLVAASVLGTMAYLTSQDAVTNTFTVGKVAITLDEAKVDVYGTEITGDDAARVNTNSYKLIPGHSYIKDPIVHFDSSSEDSYVFVKVENGISAIEAESVEGGYQNITAQITANGWTQLTDADGNSVTGVYYKKIDVSETTDFELEVFEKFEITSSAVGGEKPTPAVEDTLYLTDYATATVKVTAYAIQADGFDTAAAAWTAGGWELRPA